jgi:hypothetical protein
MTDSASRSAVNWRSSALAAPLRQPCATDCDHGSGKISSSPFSTPSKMARATECGEAFGMSRPRAVGKDPLPDIGVHGSGQHGMNAHASRGHEDSQRLRQRERAVSHLCDPPLLHCICALRKGTMGAICYSFHSILGGGIMRTYQEPSLLEPLSCSFLYVAWSVDPVRVGPFVRPSDRRRRKIDEIRHIAGVLTDDPEIDGVRLFEASFMPPLPDMPKYDVVMLARAHTTESAAQILQDRRLARIEPTTAFVATNGARFGVTENGRADANILLNHFVGPSDRSAAVKAWRALSGWYTAKVGVDNSTLLRTEDGAPFVLVNYVRLPATVVGFLLNQLLRPSFHRYVRALLEHHRLTSLPLFVRNVPMGSAGA